MELGKVLRIDPRQPGAKGSTLYSMAWVMMLFWVVSNSRVGWNKYMIWAQHSHHQSSDSWNQCFMVRVTIFQDVHCCDFLLCTLSPDDCCCQFWVETFSLPLTSGIIGPTNNSFLRQISLANEMLLLQDLSDMKCKTCFIFHVVKVQSLLCYVNVTTLNAEDSYRMLPTLISSPEINVYSTDSQLCSQDHTWGQWLCCWGITKKVELTFYSYTLLRKIKGTLLSYIRS